MNNLKKLRNKKGLTIRELADATNFNYAQLSMIENDKACFTQKQILVFTKFFRVSSDYLLGIDEETSKYYDYGKRIFLNSNGESIEISKTILIPMKILIDKEIDGLKITDLNNPSNIDIFKIKK